MKKFFEKLTAIGSDKLLHVIAGMIIAGITAGLMEICGAQKMLAICIAFFAAFIAGFVKEYCDQHVEGETPDEKDLLATLIGGVMECLILLI